MQEFQGRQPVSSWRHHSTKWWPSQGERLARVSSGSDAFSITAQDTICSIGEIEDTKDDTVLRHQPTFGQDHHSTKWWPSYGGRLARVSSSSDAIEALTVVVAIVNNNNNNTVKLLYCQIEKNIYNFLIAI